MEIRLTSQGALYNLLIVIFFLTCANISVHLIYLASGHDHIFGLRHLFDMNGEKNIPAIFSALVLLANGVLLFVLSRQYKSHRKPGWRFLAFLSICFFYLSVDEALSLHEELSPVGRLLVKGEGLFYATWIVPGAIFVLSVFLLSLRFLARVDRRTRFLMVGSGAIFVGGAIVMESLGWNYHGPLANRGLDLTYLAYSTCEELMEMLGSSLFLFTMARHAEMNFGPLVFRFGRQGWRDAIFMPRQARRQKNPG